MNIRRLALYCLDFDKNIFGQIKEIEKVNRNDEYAVKFHDKCIDALIDHAVNTVPFYKSLSVKNFDEFPVVNKVIMKESPELFISDAGLRVGKVRHTSGSTGIPFEILQNKKKAKRIQSEVIYYRELTGDSFGTKYVNLTSPSKLEKVNSLANFVRNVIPYDVTKLDEPNMDKLHNILIKNKICYMLGYASALERIADYFDKKKYKGGYSLKAVVSSSEILSDKTMLKLKHVFDCPIYDRYSNEDNGFIAQTDGESRDFILNRASYFVEILKFDSNDRAEENEIGRIVITDYFNYLQPFIRYDTGDLGAFTYKNVNGCKRYVISKLAGRISDAVYDAQGRIVSTFAIGCALEVFSKIKQYQLIQETKLDFMLNIIDPDRNYKDEEYVKVLQDLLGEEINVSVSYLDNLPSCNSGKFRRVICNYKNI